MTLVQVCPKASVNETETTLKSSETKPNDFGGIKLDPNLILGLTLSVPVESLNSPNLSL